MVDCFPLCHHLSSICLELTVDPAGRLVGSRAVGYHTATSSVSVHRKQRSVLRRREASTWDGGGVASVYRRLH